MSDAPLLIHSLAEFACITLPVLEAAAANAVCEVGAEHGGNSTVVGDWLANRDGTLVSIDPAPSQAFLDWSAARPTVSRHVPATSHDAIARVGAHDAWFLDGDHNWYTVFNELTLIRQVQREAGRPMLVFLHDIDWPWARRDLYYNPTRIPGRYLQPHSWELGVTLGSSAAVAGGFRGCGAFAVALEEGGPRNGVLTAVEDFVASQPDELLWAHIPGVFGLGVLFDRAHPAATAIADLLAPFHAHPLLARLEQSRLSNYLKVIEWQDRYAAEAAARGVANPSEAGDTAVAAATDGTGPGAVPGANAE